MDERSFAALRMTSVGEGTDAGAHYTDAGSGLEAPLTAFAVRGPFSNTLIAAPTIGRATLGRVSTGNNATSFGVAADTLRSLAAITPTQRLRLARAETPDASVVEADFAVRIL